MPDGVVLSEQDRAKLDGIVQKMIANKESEDNIRFVVDDFKNKYGLKKKGSSEPTSQEGAGVSPTRTTQPSTSSDTEPPTRAQASVALGGPTKLFGQEEQKRPTSIMYGDGLKSEAFVPPSTPIDAQPKKYYRVVADERKNVQSAITTLEDKNLKLGRSLEEIQNDGTYQYLQKKKQQLDEEFRPAALAIKEVKKDAAFGTGIIERLISSATEGKYSYLSTETIKLDKDVEDKLIDLYDNAPEEIKQKWYKGALPLEKKEELINAAKTDVLNTNYKKLKEENKYFLTNIKDNTSISQEEKIVAYNILKAKNEAFDAKVASEFADDILKDNFKATTKSKNLDEAIMGRFKGFLPEQADVISTFLEGMGQIAAKVETAIPEMILMGGERFNQMIGTSDENNYTPIEATLDLINDTTNLNFLPSSKIEKGKIVTEGGDFNINLYSIEKSLANTLPFTLKIMNDVKKGRIEGAPQSMISQLINPKYSKGFADKLRVVETAYKATIGDNYRDAKDMGMDDSKAYTYANVLSLAEGVSENIMPDFKYFDSLTGATLKNAFKGSLKSAATKQAAKNVTKDFFKNVALELGEEEFVLAVEDGLKYSLLLNHKNSEFFNLKRQKELLAATVIMSGGMGIVGAPGKFTENRNDIYREVYNNIDNLQDSFNAEINSPLNDEKTKQTFRDAYKFASDVSNAIAKAPQNVTADQVDLLVQKNKLEEKKKTIDAAFHPDINEEIAGIDTKIRELAKAPAVEEMSVNASAVEVTEEKIDNRPIAERQAEAESKIKRKDLFTGVGEFSSELGGSDKSAVPVSHKEKNGIEFVEYAHPDTGSVDVIVTGKSDNDFVGFYRIYENGKPTNKWSSKFENQSRNKEDFKTMISGVQEMLPEGHEYTEKTSISTDGLRVWNQQLEKGYEIQTDEKGNIVTNEVAINGDAINNELGIPVDQGSFNNISVTNNKQFDSVKKALLPYLNKLGLNESNIRWEDGTVKIDLPVLRKTKKEAAPAETKTETAPVETINLEQITKNSYVDRISRYTIEKVGNNWVVKTEVEGKELFKSKTLKGAKEFVSNDNQEALRVQPTEAKEEAAKPTETEVTATEEIAPSDIETTLDEVITPASKNIKEQIARAKKAISKFLPNVEIVYHTTAESFKSVVGDNSRGYYDTGTKKIHINGSNATNNTVAHEVFHAVILKYITSDKQATDLTNRMFKALVKSLKGNPKLLTDINKFAESYSKGLQSEEKLAEILGYLASEYETLPDVSKNIIQKWIEKIAKMVGIKKFTDQEVVDFMNTIATKVAYGQEITEADVKAINQGLSINIGSPVNLSRNQKGTEIEFTDSPKKLSFVTNSDKIDINKLIDDIIKNDQSVWFWMADQLGRGNYYDDVIDGEHYLDAGPSFALDPKNKNNGVLWASGLAKKTLQSQIDKTDYIFFISGSPERSKLFNRRVLDLVAERINKNSNFNDFKKSINEFEKETAELTTIKDALNSVSSFDELAKSTKRKPFLIAIGDISKNKTSPKGSLKELLNSFNAFVDYNELRDGFYKENGFTQNDIMLVGRPTGLGGKSEHSTYETEILGEVIGVPDKKINSWDIMPEEIKEKYKKIISGKEEKTKAIQNKIIAGETGIVRKIKNRKQILGENAKLSQDIRDNLDVARNMELLKKSDKEIRLVTGWERGADKKWRYEIPDNIPFLKDTVRTVGEFLSENKGTNQLYQKANYFLPKELLDLYPELNDVTIKFDNKGDESEGSYDTETKTIEVSIGVYPSKTVSSLIHEVQHAIQEIEGFSEGGSLSSSAKLAILSLEKKLGKRIESTTRKEMLSLKLNKEEENFRTFILNSFYKAKNQKQLLNLIDKESYKVYKNLIGEVEARNVERRMNATPEARRRNTLRETEDVAREDQIIFFKEKTSKVSGRKQKLAPNGKPSNLDNNQWEQVRTTEFKNWFGDWENDPENSSKVVDENGEPLVVFHGTNANFDEFKNKVGIRGNQFTGAREVISDTYFFTDDIEYAEKAAKVRVENFKGKRNIISSFLNIRKPLDFTTFDYKTEELFKEFTGLWPHEYFGYNDNFDQWWRLFDKDEDDITEKVKSKGYNGVMLAEESKSIKNDKGYTIEVASIKSFGVFNPNQIKSATENTGEFSTENISIRRQKQISPENSSNYANMTEDGKGNFVFYHFGPRGIKAIDPKKYGSNKGAITSKPEIAAMGRVGGMSQFYTMPEYQESNVSGDKYMIKVPMDKVYDFNTDPDNLYDKAREMFKRRHPDLPFTANDQLAYITKLAEKAGYDMTVAEWNNMSRAQSTKALKPVDTQIMEGNVISKPFKEDYESNSAKGFVSVVPTSKEAKLKDVYKKINAERNAKNRYDSLYSLAEDFPKLSQDKITDMIESSDISQEMKDAYAEALAYEPGARMSGRRQVNAKAIAKNTKAEVDRVKALPINAEDGATFNLDGTKYEGGGLVVPMNSLEGNTTQDKLSPEMIGDFAKENEDSISDESMVKMGIYKFPDSKTVSIDMNIVIPNEHREVALEFGALTGQKSLFDLDTFEYVETGGDGLNTMKLTPAQFREAASSLKNGIMPTFVSGRRQKSPIDTAVETAKRRGFNDKDIADYLVGKGYTRAQATKAILRYNNVTAVKLRKEDSVFTKEGRNKIVTFLDQVKRRALSARSFLPKSVFLSKDKIESNIKAEAKRASYLVDDFNRLVKKYKGDVNALNDEFDKYLRGDKTAVLPNEFKAVAGKMRMHIDNLSQMLLRTGAVSVSQAETIAANLGQYINRSYQVFDKKNWVKQVTDEMREAARVDLRNMYRAEAESKAKQTGMDADIILEDFINKKIEELISGEDAATFLGISKTGAKNLGIMKERLDIPLSIRQLMGEYTDASQNYARTVIKIATLAENARFLQSARESGRGVFFFNENDPNRPKEFNTKIAGDKSDTMSPLNGLYTTPEIAKAFTQKIGTGDAIEAALGSELGPVVRGIYETYMKALSAVKWLKTIGSVATHAKNVTGNIWFMLSNGYYNPKKYAEAFSVLKNSSNEQLRDKLDEYIRAGIIDQSAALGEIKAMFADADFETAIESRLKKNPFDKAKAGVKKLGQKMTTAYQLEDDFFKIISYESEKARYSNAYFDKPFDDLTDDQKILIKNYAAEITKNVLPNYSRIPGLVKLLKAVPVTGTFVSFQAEAYRTAWNTVALAADELKSSNKKVRAIGAKRLAGIAASQAAKFGLMALMGTIVSGGDDDDDDELKKNTKLFVAPWSKDSDLVLVDYGGGKMSYIDFSASDPHGGIRKAYNSVMAGKDITESFTNGLTQLLEPFMKEDMLLNVITDIKDNKNAYGGKLYNESDTDVNKIKAIMGRVYKAFEPGTITSVRKIVGSDDVRNELAGQLTGYKISTVDVNNQLGFKMNELKDLSGGAKSLYSSAFYKFEDGTITGDELDKIYEQANKSQKEVYENMMKYMNAASFFGVDDYMIEDNMQGVGKSVINDLWYGEAPDMKMKEVEE